MKEEPRSNADILAEELQSTTGYLLKRTQQVIEAVLSSEQIPHPPVLSQVQFEALTAVRNISGCDQVTLAKAIGIDKSSTTAVIDKLEKLTLVCRESHQDRRKSSLVLAPNAEKLLLEDWARRKRAELRLLSVLSEGQAVACIQHLQLFANIGDSGAPDWVMPDIVSNDTAQASPLFSELFTSMGFLLRRCGQVGRGFGVQNERESDLTEGQGKMLYAICAIGEVDMSQLVEMFATERATFTVIRDALIKRGFVKQEQNPADRRHRIISPTQNGIKRMKMIQVVWTDIENCLIERLTPPVYTDLIKLLKLLT